MITKEEYEWVIKRLEAWVLKIWTSRAIYGQQIPHELLGGELKAKKGSLLKKFREKSKENQGFSLLLRGSYGRIISL
jgi:hypothetical protein